MAHPQIATHVGRPVVLRGEDRRGSPRIDAEFQGRFRIAMLAFAVGLVALVALVLSIVMQMLRNPGLLPPEVWVPVIGLASAGGIAFLIYYVCDRLSHRYCGPVHRIVRQLEAIEAGERPRPIRLRENDEFQELVERLNATLVRLGAIDDD